MDCKVRVNYTNILPDYISITYERTVMPIVLNLGELIYIEG